MRLLGLMGSTAFVLAASYGCGSSGEDASGTNTGGGDSSSNSASGGDGSGGDLFPAGSGGSGQGGDSACAAVSQEADLVNRPVDIVFVIDNSGSMGDEIVEVERQVNQNFTSILNSANPPIDYRVILVSEFGNANPDESICISAPLGGVPDANMDGRCDSVPSQPVETSNFFHYSVRVESHDALCILLDQYEPPFQYNPPWGAIGPDQYNVHPNGWKPLLRQEAFKFITVISDDGVNCDLTGTSTNPAYNDANSVAGGNAVASTWDAALLTMDAAQFGTASDRNYTFWSIISEQEFMKDGVNPFGLPIPSTTTINTSECDPNLNPGKSGGNPVDPGTGYQALSILTDGYRYPTCALDYTDIFQLMAEGVIDGAQVSCEFEVPEPPAGEQLDLETVEVIYSSNGSEQATYTQVASVAACTPNSFYIEDDLIKLCPDACSAVQQDENAKIDLRFDCKQVVE